MACIFSTSQLPKVVRPSHAVTDFHTFHFKTWFAPQRRALFRHRNFQKCSNAEVFCTFLLPNVFRATTACNFSTSQLPKVVRTCGALALFTSKCVSHPDGVQFSSLIWPAGFAPAALASLPPEPQNIGKTQFFATFLRFRAPAASLF